MTDQTKTSRKGKENSQSLVGPQVALTHASNMCLTNMVKQVSMVLWLVYFYFTNVFICTGLNINTPKTKIKSLYIIWEAWFRGFLALVLAPSYRDGVFKILHCFRRSPRAEKTQDIWHSFLGNSSGKLWAYFEMDLNTFLKIKAHFSILNGSKKLWVCCQPLPSH
jgi:hypothetical protein